MKLLLDQNLSRRLLAEIETVFPGSTQVQVLGLDRASGAVLWDYAREHGFAIVTKDVDFVELQLLRGFPPKVVWLNCGNVSNAEVRLRLLGHAEAIKAMLASNEAGVLEID